MVRSTGQLGHSPVMTYRPAITGDAEILGLGGHSRPNRLDDAHVLIRSLSGVVVATTAQYCLREYTG